MGDCGRKYLGEVLKKCFNKEDGKESYIKQLAIASACGWCVGFVTMGMGKTFAISLGGGIILLQVAKEKNYIKVNWKKVNSICKKFKERKVDNNSEKMDDNRYIYKESCDQKGEDFFDKTLEFAKSNSTISVGFLGGFLIGLASH